MAVDVGDAFGLSAQRGTDVRLIKQCIDGAEIGRIGLHRLFDILDWRVAGDARKFTRQISRILVRFQFGTERLRATNLDLVHLVEVGVDFFEAAKMIEQRAGGFLTDPWYTGYVVHAVARQGEKVRDLLGPNAEHFRHPVIADFSSSGEISEDVILCQELCKILVTGDNR